MSTPPLTEAMLREAIAAVAEHGNQTAAAAALGVPRGTFQHRYHTAIKRGLDDAIVHPAPQGHTIKGVSTLYNSAGGIISQWVKTRTDGPSLEEIIESVKGAFDEYNGVSQLGPAPLFSEADTLTVYPLVDWHVGLLAWSRETGEDYGLKIARDVIMRAMARVISSSPPSAHAVVLGMGDMLHFDGYEPVTSRSRNFLDADGRYPKVLKTATEMIVATIDLALQRHETVAVRILPGNHDDQSAVALSLALSMFYTNNARVAVDDSPSRFWWFRFGKVFLGGTHGENAKMRDMPLIMAHDRPQDWAASSYRRIYTGHIHHESTVEEGGVIVTSMRSPVAKDAYHSFNRWRSGRSVYSETFNADGSEAAAVQINI